MLLSRCGAPFAVEFQNFECLFFLNSGSLEKCLLIRISPVLDKDAFTQKLEKTDIKVIKDATETKLKRKHFQHIEFYFYDKDNFIRVSTLAWLLINKVGSLHLHSSSSNWRYEGFIQVVQIGVLDPFPILEISKARSLNESI